MVRFQLGCKRNRRVGGGVWAVGVVGLAGLGVGGRAGAGGGRQHVAAGFAGTDFEDAAATAAFRSGLYAKIRRRPAEPYYYQMAGHAAARASDEAVLPWLTLALTREPNHASTQVLVAWVYANRGSSDLALDHLRRAAESDWAAVGNQVAVKAVA